MSFTPWDQIRCDEDILKRVPNGLSEEELVEVALYLGKIKDNIAILKHKVNEQTLIKSGSIASKLLQSLALFYLKAFKLLYSSLSKKFLNIFSPYPANRLLYEKTAKPTYRSIYPKEFDKIEGINGDGRYKKEIPIFYSSTILVSCIHDTITSLIGVINENMGDVQEQMKTYSGWFEKWNAIHRRLGPDITKKNINAANLEREKEEEEKEKTQAQIIEDRIKEEQERVKKVNDLTRWNRNQVQARMKKDMENEAARKKWEQAQIEKAQAQIEKARINRERLQVQAAQNAIKLKKIQNKMNSEDQVRRQEAIQEEARKKAMNAALLANQTQNRVRNAALFVKQEQNRVRNAALFAEEGRNQTLETSPINPDTELVATPFMSNPTTQHMIQTVTKTTKAPTKTKKKNPRIVHIESITNGGLRKKITRQKTHHKRNKHRTRKH